MPLDERPEVRAAGLLLAFDQELEVDRQPARRPQERLGDEDRDQHGPLSSETPRA